MENKIYLMPWNEMGCETNTFITVPADEVNPKMEITVGSITYPIIELEKMPEFMAAHPEFEIRRTALSWNDETGEIEAFCKAHNITIAEDR